MRYKVGQTIRTHHLVQHRDVLPPLPITNLTASNWNFILVRDGAVSSETVSILHIYEGYYAIIFVPLAVGIYSISAQLLDNFDGSDQGGFQAREYRIQASAPDSEPWVGDGLTTLEKVHETLHLPLTTTTDDALIEDLIAANSEWIANYLDVSFVDHVTVPTVDLYSGNGGPALFLRRHIIAGIDLVTVDAVEIPEAVEVTDSGWLLDGNVLRLRGYVFIRGIQNVAVTTRWGFDVIPKLVENACLTLTIIRFKEITEHPGITWEQIGDHQYRYVPDAMPAAVAAMLDSYRRMVAV